MTGWGGAVVALPLGLATGIASVFVHAAGAVWLVLAVAAPLALVLALPRGLPRVAYGGAWSTLVLLASRGTGEGDLLVTSSLAGWTMLGAALLMIVVAVVTIAPTGGAPS